jgi:pyruvate/2-oxoglutarate dehydrogenase complex dihydrolipoamide acyltransferase (E2) component
MKAQRTLLNLLLLTTLTGVGGAALAPAPVLAAQDEEGVERAVTSSLAPITLPDGARRSTVRRDLAKFEAALQKTAETNHGRMARIEVLIWPPDSGFTPFNQLPDRLKEAGYNYVSRPAFDAEPGRVTPVAAVRKGEKDGLLGMWIENGGYLLLAWGLYRPDNPANPGHPVGTPAPSAPNSPANEEQGADPAPLAPEPAPEPPAMEPAPAPRATPAKPRAAAAKQVAAKPAAKASQPRGQQNKRVARKPKGGRTMSAAERQARAIKKLNDYNYVKHFGPISGPMYRSTKW